MYSVADFNINKFNTYLLELSKEENCMALELCDKAARLNAAFESITDDPFTNETIQCEYADLITELIDFEKSVHNITLMPLLYPHIARAHLNCNNDHFAAVYAQSGYEASKLSHLPHFARESAIKSLRVLMDIAILSGAFRSLLDIHNHCFEKLRYHQLDTAEMLLLQANMASMEPQQLEQNEVEYRKKSQLQERAPTLKYLDNLESTNLEIAIRSFMKMSGCTREEAENTAPSLMKSYQLAS